MRHSSPSSVASASEARRRTRDGRFVPKKEVGGAGAHRENGGQVDPDLKRLSEVADDQGVAGSDQSASDADQTASDADQSASDSDREQSVRDQDASDRDQRASDRDQAASDKELGEHPGSVAEALHAEQLAEREAGSTERKEATKGRALAVDVRAHTALGRDETARHRDLTAQARDGAAERRDSDSAKIERKMASRGSPLRSAITHAAGIRIQAARDRARAAEDRAAAAADRRHSAEERAAALMELRRAHLDELTGVFRRGSGEEVLRDEIDRARRGDARLVLAFVDVDALREVNNRNGHQAGDELLRSVVVAIRSKMRSYEPIVRYGGDEFVCAVGDVDLKHVQERFAVVQESLAEASVSVGLAELRPDDTLEDLIARADAALLEARRARQGAA